MRHSDDQLSIQRRYWDKNEARVQGKYWKRKKEKVV
jgi:hypothetical protein